jgi:cobalt-zinc-cadmium efflux system outer membrane protein
VLFGSPTLRAQSSSDNRSSSSEAIARSSKAVDLADVLPDNVSTERISFPDLMEIARKRAPRIRKARAQLERGEARIEGAEVLPYEPRIRAGVERFPFGESSSGEAKVGLTQRFQIGGERGTRIEAGRAFRETLQRRLDEAEWRVHARLHRLYNLAIVGRRRLRLAVNVRDFAERLLEIARRRVEAGASPEMARHVAEAELARAKQRLIEVRNDFVSTLKRLEEVSGWPREPSPIPDEAVPAYRAAGEAGILLERSRENYPPIRTQRQVLETVRAELDLAERRVWPDPTLGLFYKRQAPEVGDPVNGMIAQVALPLPILNRNVAERERKRAEIVVAETALRTLRTRLKPRLEDAIRQVNSAAERVDVYRKELLPAFRRQLELLEEGYREGRFDITEVTVARERLLENQRRSLTSREDYVRAVGQLETLLGREFWQETFDLSTSRGGSP